MQEMRNCCDGCLDLLNVATYLPTLYIVGVTRSDWKVCCLHYRLRWVGRGSGINSSLNVNQEQGKKVKTGKKKAKTEARKSQGLKKQEWQKESVTNGRFSFKSHPFLFVVFHSLTFYTFWFLHIFCMQYIFFAFYDGQSCFQYKMGFTCTSLLCFGLGASSLLFRINLPISRKDSPTPHYMSWKP